MTKINYDKAIRILILVIILCVFIFQLARAEKGIVQLGDFQLENGSFIEDCKIGYNSFGQLNNAKSNIILFPTYYGGTSDSYINYIGDSDSMLDTTKFQVIVLEAFGNGVSSSPSNSRNQSGDQFPDFTINDMVEAHYLALTKNMGIDHVYAITGISMGGMQTFQWMASHPGFFDKAAPIVGSPKLSSFELLSFGIFNRIMEGGDQNEKEENAYTALMLEYLLGFSANYLANEKKVEDFKTFTADIKKESENYNLHDMHSQMKAISKHDITLNFGGSLQKVSDQFKGDVLIVVAEKDMLLLPTQSIAFAKYANAELLALDSDCGHYAFACEIEEIGEKVAAFLN